MYDFCGINNSCLVVNYTEKYKKMVITHGHCCKRQNCGCHGTSNVASLIFVTKLKSPSTVVYIRTATHASTRTCIIIS